MLSKHKNTYFMVLHQINKFNKPINSVKRLIFLNLSLRQSIDEYCVIHSSLNCTFAKNRGFYVRSIYTFE